MEKINYMIIIATASLNSCTPSTLNKMILAGADILRFNLSYDTMEEKLDSIRVAQKIIEELNGSQKILIDLPSPKVRLGNYPGGELLIKDGDSITLQSAEYSAQPSIALPVQYPEIGKELNAEQTIVIDEGEITLKVTYAISPSSLECLAMNSGSILPLKGLYWRGQKINSDDVFNHTATTVLPFLVDIEPDFIACPIINNEAVAKKYIKAINDTVWKNKKPKIIFKIEDEEGVNEIEKIMPLCDTILLERGTLGMRSSFEKVGIYQKYVTQLCKKNRMQVIISTQILESTITNFIPKRSEILDLTNIVLDGAYGVMLCHETGVGSRPAYSISVAKKIIKEVEKNKKNILP